MSTVLVRLRTRRPPPPRPQGEILLETPPELPETNVTALRGVLTTTALIAVFTATAIAFTDRELGRRQLAVVVLLSLALLALTWSHMRLISGERRARLSIDRREYLRYLGQVHEQTSAIARAQRAALDWSHPHPGRLWTVVMSARLWEHRRTDADFGQVRVATGSQPLAVLISPPPDIEGIDPRSGGPGARRFEDFDPICAEALRTLLRTHTTVPDLPAVVDLTSFTRVVVRGEPEAAQGLVRALLMQLAAFHSPADLRISVCAPRDQAPWWQWIKWLPHALHPDRRDTVGPVRLFADRPSGLDALIGTEVRNLLGRGPGPFQGPDLLHVVVVDGELPPERSFLDDHIAGVCVIDLTGALAAGPEASTVRVEVTPDQVKVTQREESGELTTRATGRPDYVTVAQAEALARQLAPLRISTPGRTGQADTHSFPMSLPALFGVADLRALDPAELWRPKPAPQHLRVPIGVDVDGQPVELDLKELAQGGMGPHGLCIGATGSGKSELLRTLVLGLAMTHSPDVLTFVLVDFKGGATFAGMDRLRHVTGLITSLQDEPALVDRMFDALHGELVRRQERLRTAGNYSSLRVYNEARAEGAPLEPMPRLILVVDEFFELLSVKPDFAEVLVMIGRLGRSLGVHMLLASQRLEEGRLRGLDTHLSYRIGLRTFSAAESRAMLGVPDAYELPRAPGHGYLKTGPDRMLRFLAAHLSGPALARPRMRVSASSSGQVLLFGTDVVPRDPATAEPVAAGPEQPPERLDQVIVRQLAGQGHLPQPVWLPPLAEPPTLDELLPPLSETRAYGGRPAASEPARTTPCAVVGVVDDPFRQERSPYRLDLSGAAGHVGIAGMPGSGASTLILTLIASLALQHSPKEVQVYCLDFGSGRLAALRDLPHVGGVAGRHEPERVRRTVAEVAALAHSRERLFAEHGIDSIAAYRRSRATGESPDDGYGDVFLVVDGWHRLREEYERLEQTIVELATQGLAHGVHLVVSADRWPVFRPAVQDLLGTRLELRLHDPSESLIDRRRAENVPAGRPGRGLTKQGLHFLTALPRIDGDSRADSTANGVADLVGAVRSAWHGPPAPPIRLLPARLAPSALPAPSADDDRLAIGIDEETLAPVFLDFTHDPHFLVIGDNECGKSTLLRHITTGITRRYTPEQARIVFIDYSRSLLDVASTKHQIAYAASSTAAVQLVKDIHGAMMNRLPPADFTPDQLRAGPWWTGADLFLIVDDYELVGTSDNPLRPLVELLPQARDIRLHLVVARAMGGAGRSMFDPIIQRIKEMGSPGLIMSGTKDEGALLGNVKAGPLPPGRGHFVDRRGVRLIQTPLSESPGAHDA